MLLKQTILLLPLSFGLALGQQEAQPEDAYAGLRRVMVMRYSEWSSANEKLRDAQRQLDPCSRKLMEMLTAVKEAGNEALIAVNRYVDTWTTDINKEVEILRKLSADASANYDQAKAMLKANQEESAALERRAADLAKQLENKNELENLKNGMERNRKSLEEAVKASQEAEANAASMRDLLQIKEDTVKTMLDTRIVEKTKMMGLYDLAESEIRRRCSSKNMPVDPFNIPSMQAPRAEDPKGAVKAAPKKAAAKK